MNQDTKPAAVAVVATPLATLALAFASRQVGQREQPLGSNRGPMVDKYLAAVGLPPGNPWCQAFVRWCYLEAAHQDNVKCPVPLTGLVLLAWKKLEPVNRIGIAEFRKNPSLVKPGAQFFMDFGRGTGHTGIVEHVNLEQGIYLTIEGNSNDEGSREGYEVCRRTRKLNDKRLVGFANY